VLYWMGDPMQPASRIQEIALVARSRVKRRLYLRQLACHLGCPHPESIPEPLARLQGKSRASRHRTLSCHGQQTERDTSRARTPQQLADGHRPLRVGARDLGRPF